MDTRTTPSKAAGDPATAEPSRRETVLGLALAVLSLLPATGQAKPARVVRLRAVQVRRRLGNAHQPESTLFRLLEVDAGGTPATASDSRGDATFTVIRGREGEPFQIEIENALDQPASFHLRGMRGPNRDDGVAGLTTLALAPGARTTIPIPALQTGTFLLTPVLPGTVSEQSARGLHAAVIVEEKASPGFDHDFVLAVGDWRLDETGVLAGDFGARRDAARVGRLGNRLVANGRLAPGMMTVRPGAWLRIRVINVSNARLVPLTVEGFPAQVYAIDSTPCQPFDPLKRTVILTPSSRIEIVLQAPAEAGRAGAIEAKLGDGFPIFRFRTEGVPLPERGKLAALPDPGLPTAIPLQGALRAQLIVTGGLEALDPKTSASGSAAAELDPAALEKRFPDPTRIFTVRSGIESAGSRSARAPVGAMPSYEVLTGYSGRPIASIRRGSALVLAFLNRTAWPQVLAVHGHAFRLLHPFDDGWEPYFLDTLYLAPGTTARIALVADNPGKWAIRSTIAEHLASGVVTWFEVT